MIATPFLLEHLIPTQHIDIRIGSLRHEPHLYDNYPIFQREKVWPFSMKRSLIDSILRGFPVPELLANRKDHQFWIIDGQQRLSTILEFLAGGFTTARLKEDPCLQPIEPNKRYSSLSSQVRERFDNYTLRISVMDNMDEKELGALFRRLQHQQSLQLAEKLWTFSSQAHQQASLLANHEFWQKIYQGKQTRKRTFLASLYLVAIELAQGTTNLTAPCLREVAAGSQDDQVKPTLIDTMEKRLNQAQYLFYGTSIQSLKEIIPLYQAIILLEKSDCDFAKSEQGCLFPWIARVKQESLAARRTYGATDILAKMPYGSYQLEFWAEELPKLKEMKGVCLIDQRRIFSKIDREQALARQNGVCLSCGLPISLSDIGHHVILHAKGGPTTTENCSILHEACHSRMHSMPGVEWEVVKEAS